MALCSTPRLLNASCITKKNFSTTCISFNKWRRQQGLEDNPRKFSPLTYLPDYSFLDKRPTPLTFRKYEKLQLQKKYCQRIVELSNEIDVALENYNKRQEEEKQKIDNILKNKLKPKGAALLEEQNQNKQVR